MRIVIASDRIDEIASGYKAAFGDVAFTNNELPCMSYYFIGIGIKITDDTVHLQILIDITENYPVIVSLFLQVPVITEGRFINKEQGSADITFNRILIGRKREKQFMESLDVFPRFNRTILGQILRQSKDKRLSTVQNIYFLPLLLGKVIGAP